MNKESIKREVEQQAADQLTILANWFYGYHREDIKLFSKAAFSQHRDFYTIAIKQNKSDLQLFLENNAEYNTITLKLAINSENLGLNDSLANIRYIGAKARTLKSQRDLIISQMQAPTADYESLARKLTETESAIQQRDVPPAVTNTAAHFLKIVESERGNKKPCIKTGFNCFDEEMDGGLYPGLYILGAISSMGKTALMLQIADQVAAKGNSVLYITLEMGAQELIARSISRYSYLAAEKSDIDALTARSVTNGSIFNNYQKINIDKAIKQYQDTIATNLWFCESLGDIGIEEIRNEVKRQYDLTGSAPIVFIDYLQILKPYNESWTEKRNTDKAVTELRKLARDYKTPVFCISSLNRDSYKGDIDLNAFKESGAIEYGSDVLLALQTPGLESGLTPKEAKANKEAIESEKKKPTRDLELKVLKNRSGSTGQRIPFIYNAKYNYFYEKNAGSEKPKQQKSNVDLTF